MFLIKVTDLLSDRTDYRDATAIEIFEIVGGGKQGALGRYGRRGRCERYSRNRDRDLFNTVSCNGY